MNPPAAPDNVSQIVGTVDFVTKAAAVVLTAITILEKVIKPYGVYRDAQREAVKSSFAQSVRDLLRPELDKLDRVTSREEECVERQELVLQRQREMFTEFDHMLAIVVDGYDRINEINTLLDVAGFSSERRVDTERRKQATLMLQQLNQRMIERRRLATEAENALDAEHTEESAHGE